jgi:competence protein ComEA
MELYSIIERLKPHWLPLLIGVLGLGFLVYGMVALQMPQEETEKIQFEAGSVKAEAINPTNSPKTITVDIEGAVQKPGVYSLPVDSRVQDAITAAGGLSTDADLAKVSRGLNLASKLPDGGKIYIPALGEEGTVVSGGVSTDLVLGASSGTINLNTASLKELDTLPGVGEVTAQKIINNRPYSASGDLITKKVVSQKVFEQIKEKVSVY